MTMIREAVHIVVKDVGFGASLPRDQTVLPPLTSV